METIDKRDSVGIGYWIWRTIKSIFWMIVYYVSLFASGLVFYPRGEYVDVNRGEKLIMGLNESIPLVFIICSVIVIVWSVIRHKKWLHKYQIMEAYNLFAGIQIVYLIAFSIVNPQISWIYYIGVIVVFNIISWVIGKTFGKSVMKIKNSDE